MKHYADYQIHILCTVGVKHCSVWCSCYSVHPGLTINLLIM